MYCATFINSATKGVADQANDRKYTPFLAISRDGDKLIRVRSMVDHKKIRAVSSTWNALHDDSPRKSLLEYIYVLKYLSETSGNVHTLKIGFDRKLSILLS